MKSPINKATELFSTILSIGIRAYVIATIVEAVLVLIALTVGIIIWINKDFFAGLGTGMAVFIFGQILVMIILDLILIAPEREAAKTRLPSDDEVLQSLRAELTTQQSKSSRPLKSELPHGVPPL